MKYTVLFAALCSVTCAQIQYESITLESVPCTTSNYTSACLPMYTKWGAEVCCATVQVRNATTNSIISTNN